MQDARMCCGLMMFKKADDKYYCVDGYTMEIKCSGTFEECDKYFNNYIQRIAERD